MQRQSLTLPPNMLAVTSIKKLKTLKDFALVIQYLSLNEVVLTVVTDDSFRNKLHYNFFRLTTKSKE